MLDNNTITLTEAIFLVIDCKCVNNFVENMIKEHIYIKRILNNIVI